MEKFCMRFVLPFVIIAALLGFLFSVGSVLVSAWRHGHGAPMTVTPTAPEARRIPLGAGRDIYVHDYVDPVTSQRFLVFEDAYGIAVVPVVKAPK